MPAITRLPAPVSQACVVIAAASQGTSAPDRVASPITGW